MNGQSISKHLWQFCDKSSLESWEYVHPNASPWTRLEDNLVYQLVRRMGMKWTMISKALGDRTPLQVKNCWYSILRKREVSVFDNVDMMMALRSRVRKGESIPDLILD
jgi:hypothetical protein